MFAGDEARDDEILPDGFWPIFSGQNPSQCVPKFRIRVNLMIKDTSEFFYFLGQRQ